MRSTLRIASLVGAALLATSAFSAGIEGTWKGKVFFKMPPLPANAPAQQKTFVKNMAAQLAKASISLVIKKDKTYTAKAVGMPGPADKGDKGTWTQVGNKVTLKSTKPGDQPKAMTLAGNKMTLLLPNNMGQIVFTK